MDTETIIIIIAFILITLINVGINWWFAYSKKDAEYEAINDNLSIIQKQTGAIEKIKNRLSIRSQHKINLQAEKRLAIFHLYESLFNHYQTLLFFTSNIDFHQNTIDTTTTDKEWNSIQLAIAKYELLVDDNYDFTKKLLQLQGHLIAMKKHIDQSSYDLLETYRISPKEVSKLDEKQTLETSKFVDLILPVLSEIKEMLKVELNK